MPMARVLILILPLKLLKIKLESLGLPFQIPGGYDSGRVHVVKKLDEYTIADFLGNHQRLIKFCHERTQY